MLNMHWTTARGRGFRRAFTLSALALLAFSGALPARATSGMPDTTFILYRVRATAGGSTTLCPGDVLSIRAAVWAKVSRTGGSEDMFAEITPGITGAEVRAAVQDPAVGSVSPSSGYTLADDDGPNADFVFVAGEPGSTEIVFEYVASAPLSKYMPSAPTQAGVDPQKTQSAPTEDANLPQQKDTGPLAPQAVLLNPTPAKLEVQVRACEHGYRITVSSAWVIPGEARQIYAFSFLTTTAEPSPDSFTVSTSMHNNGFWVGPCTATITYQDSSVDIEGRVVSDPSEPSLSLSLVYGPVSSHTVESCAGGTSDDVSTPDDLHLSFPATGGSQTVPHAVQGTVGATGTSTITVTRLGP